MTSDKKLLMVVGAGAFQLKAIREAKSLGLLVLAIDQDANAPGAAEADYFEAVSTRGIEQAIACARKYTAKFSLQGVFTAGTDVAYTVACVAEALSLPGIRPENALAATNKFLMRQRLENEGLLVPKFNEADSLERALLAAELIGYPLVIKPADSMGARGVQRIENEKELRDVFGRTLSFSGRYSDAKVILESYIEADEISMDTLVEAGEVHLITIADRHIGYPPYFVEYGHSIPSRLSQEKLTAAFETMKQAIKAVGIDQGAAKADIRISEEGVFIGEITARLSGGYHSQFTEYFATGMNSTRAAIQIALGEKVDRESIEPKWNRVCLERALIPEVGEISSIEGVEAAGLIEGVQHIFIHKKVGDMALPVVDNLGKSANIIVTGDTFEEAEAVLEKAFSTLCIKTIPKGITVA